METNLNSILNSNCCFFFEKCAWRRPLCEPPDMFIRTRFHVGGTLSSYFRNRFFLKNGAKRTPNGIRNLRKPIKKRHLKRSRPHMLKIRRPFCSRACGISSVPTPLPPPSEKNTLPTRMRPFVTQRAFGLQSSAGASSGLRPEPRRPSAFEPAGLQRAGRETLFGFQKAAFGTQEAAFGIHKAIFELQKTRFFSPESLAWVPES